VIAVFDLSACLELLFTEAGPDHGDRVRAAAACGLPAVEIWSWRDKDLDRLQRALRETGTALATMCTDPMSPIVDPATHRGWLAGVEESVRVADRLGAPRLVVTAGDVRPGVPRDAQHAAVVAALRAAAPVAGSYGVTLLLENLNSRVDHVGTFLDSTVECVDIVREVDSPAVRMLYDHYHSLVMGERPDVVLAGAIELVDHVQIADVPGRHEPGTGTIGWAGELSILHGLGYRGLLGLECRPTRPTTAALAHIVAAAAGPDGLVR
jgi:hydroxypyruvate isomerase